MATLSGSAAADIVYQSQILQHVSRTFALNIPQLPVALRDVVANVYALCRIADTIEDEPALSPARKAAFLERFSELVAGRGDAAAFSHDLGALLSSASTAHERELVANTARVVRITRGFPTAQRRTIERCLRVMSRGMAEFQQDVTPEGLPDLRALDRYCYHVAGIVGETLTDLFADYSVEIRRHRDDLLELSVSFGQGLQMVNILKDVREDRLRGACWLPRDVFPGTGLDIPRSPPAREAAPGFAEGLSSLVAITRDHLANGLQFVLTIPAHEAGIRRFCLWPLGMAVLTLRRVNAAPGFRTGQDVKISRRSVRAVTVVARILERSNVPLKVLFRGLTQGLPHTPHRPHATRSCGPLRTTARAAPLRRDLRVGRGERDAPSAVSAAVGESRRQ